MKKISVLAIDHVELYVGNLFQSAHFYQQVLGFQVVASKQDTEAGISSLLLRQKDITLILTAATDPTSQVAEWVYRHDDGVRDIAFQVEHVGEVFDEVIKRGATAIQPPTLLEDDQGKVVKAIIGTFGDTVHTLIERSNPSKDVFPGFTPISTKKLSTPLFSTIDHIAFCLEAGSLLRWRDFYTHVLDFTQTHREDVPNPQGGMNSLVVENQAGTCVFPMIEPTKSTMQSQVKRFLNAFGGSGVQHFGLLTSDIVKAVRELSDKGLNFLDVPDAYYEVLSQEFNVNELSYPLSDLANGRILVDRVKQGYLYQNFSEVIQTRPTFFIELIQRVGVNKGFGSGNIRALFASLEKTESATLESNE